MESLTQLAAPVYCRTGGCSTQFWCTASCNPGAQTHPLRAMPCPPNQPHPHPAHPPQVIEMRERAYWVTHWVEDSVDCLLTGRVPIVQASL